MANQVKARLISNKKVGSYHHLIFAGDGIATGVRPGHFAAVAVGDENSPMILRRAFSIHKAAEITSRGSTLELIVAAHGPGTSWLVAQHEGAIIDVVAPLGKPFALPKTPANCLLVAGGYGSAPMVYLAQELIARGCKVDIIFGAGTESKLFDVLEAKRLARYFEITTDDGSAGTEGRVSTAMPVMMAKGETEAIYACGPMPMLQSVADLASKSNIISQCAVEESMACGIGVCMTCVLPVIGDDGITRMVRSCTDGPVFRGDKVRWDEIGTVPADCLGAPKSGGH
jgi:dihydroorotate dehydrogenase electron transfer subunit